MLQGRPQPWNLESQVHPESHSQICSPEAESTGAVSCKIIWLAILMTASMRARNSWGLQSCGGILSWALFPVNLADSLSEDLIESPPSPTAHLHHGSGRGKR